MGISWVRVQLIGQFIGASSPIDEGIVVSVRELKSPRARHRRFVRHGAREISRVEVSVVIPTLNEARNLPHVFSELPSDVGEVIVVDGLSTDGTPEVARTLRPDVKIVDQTGRGKGNALMCGFAAARGEMIVMMDADGSSDPAEIPRFIGALKAGADFAKGTRFAKGGGSADITFLRRAGNWVLSRMMNVLFGTSYTDLCYGYNAFWRYCVPVIDVDCDGFEVESLMIARASRAGLRVAEVASFERPRIHGVSNLSAFRDGRRVLHTIVRERLRPSPRQRPRPVRDLPPDSKPIDAAGEAVSLALRR